MEGQEQLGKMGTRSRIKRKCLSCKFLTPPFDVSPVIFFSPPSLPHRAAAKSGPPLVAPTPGASQHSDIPATISKPSAATGSHLAGQQIVLLRWKTRRKSCPSEVQSGVAVLPFASQKGKGKRNRKKEKRKKREKRKKKKTVRR